MAASSGAARLVRLFDTLERFRSAELRLAAAAVAVVASATEGEQAHWQRAVVDGRDALRTGAREHWMQAEASMAFTEFRYQRLRVLHAEREEVRVEAEALHLASRVRTEQMKHMAERARAEERVERERRDQANADDRYLSRRDWQAERVARDGMKQR